MKASKQLMKTIVIGVFVCLLGMSPFYGHAQSKKKLNIEGDFYFDTENYAQSSDMYQQSADVEADFQSLYNLGVTKEKQSLTDDAIASYESAINYAENDEARSVAFYNMGNTLMQDQENLTKENLEQAIEYYKSALRYNKSNQPAMHNLATAQITLDMMQKQEEQQEQQQEQQEQQEQEDQEQQEQEDQQDQEQQQNQQQEQQEQQEQEAKQEEREEIDQKEIENILKMVEKEDQEVQEKMRKQSKSDNTEKKKKW